jgi:hypothetical protein
LLIFALSIPCFAADHEFKSVVSAIESQYRARHTHVPMLGFASFCLRISRSGVSGFKLAVFTNMRERDVAADAALEQAIESSLGEDWHPLVRVRSRRDNELTLIYSSESEREMKLLVVALESGDATVVQMKINPTQIKKWLDDPEEMARTNVHQPVVSLAPKIETADNKRSSNTLQE